MRMQFSCLALGSFLTLVLSTAATAASFTPLGDLAGGIFHSVARGVSADGSTVVGGSGGGGYAIHAFVWDATNGMRSLQLLLTSQGFDLTGWQLQEATGVSADGNIIVGFGTNPSGDTEAFLANVLPPRLFPGSRSVGP